jgi:hypothetical protein
LDFCRYDRLVTSLSHYGVLCALRVSLSHLWDFVQEIFPFWIVGAPHIASEIPLLPFFGILASASFPCMRLMLFPVGFQSFFLPSTDSEMGQGYVWDHSFRTFVVTIDLSPLCLITAFSVL